MLSLFTGGGGLDRGLEAAGLETVGCVELDDACRRSLEKNRPGWKLLDFADALDAARFLTPASLGLAVGELDVVAGGPPCQPFSVASQWTNSGRRGMSDARAATVGAMLDLVEVFQPRALLIENVAGFLRGEISALPFVTERLEQINQKSGTRYSISAEVVDSADYGVPQRRRRVIAVATRDGENFSMPDPTHSDAPMTAWDAIGAEDETDPAPCRGEWAGLLPSIPEGGNYQYLTARGGGEEIFGYRTRYWSYLLKLAKDQPSWTISASPGPSTGPFHWDNRPLTPRERMLLQSFPADWEFVGTVGERIKQAGNATPPLLAEVIGRALKAQVLSPDEPGDEKLELLPIRATETPPPVPPRPVPDRYRHLIGPKRAHGGTGRGPSPRMDLA